MQRVCVVSYGGMVLWEHDWSAKSLQRDPINGLIHDVLLEDRAGEKEYVSAIDDVKVKWVMATEAQFFVVAVFQRFLHLLCIEQLLSCIKDSFISKYGRQLTDKLYDFEEVFAQLYEAFEANEQRLSSAGSTTPKKTETKSQRAAMWKTLKEIRKTRTKRLRLHRKARCALDSYAKALLRATQLLRVEGSSRAAALHAAAKAPPASSAGKSKKPVKQPRKWDGAGQEPEPEQAEQQPSEETLAARDESVRANMLRRDAAGNVVKTDEHNWSTVPTAPPKRGLVATWLRSHFGSREVDVQDFSAIIPKLREKLITKNVAVEVAEEVCKSVEVSVRGTKLGHFDSLSKAIEKAMVDALHRILQPKTEVNILRSVAAAKERHRPYSIVFLWCQWRWEVDIAIQDRLLAPAERALGHDRCGRYVPQRGRRAASGPRTLPRHPGIPDGLRDGSFNSGGGGIAASCQTEDGCRLDRHGGAYARSRVSDAGAGSPHPRQPARSCTVCW